MIRKPAEWLQKLVAQEVTKKAYASNTPDHHAVITQDLYSAEDGTLSTKPHNEYGDEVNELFLRKGDKIEGFTHSEGVDWYTDEQHGELSVSLDPSWYKEF